MDEFGDEMARLPATPLGRGIGQRNARVAGGAAGVGATTIEASLTKGAKTKTEDTLKTIKTEDTPRPPRHDPAPPASAASTLSLQHAPTPTDMAPRAVLRCAVRMLVRAVQRPPPHMCRTAQGLRDWDEVEARVRGLGGLARAWDLGKGKEEGCKGRERRVGREGEGGREEGQSEEGWERRCFWEAVGDGYVLCQ